MEFEVLKFQSFSFSFVLKYILKKNEKNILFSFNLKYNTWDYNAMSLIFKIIQNLDMKAVTYG